MPIPVLRPALPTAAQLAPYLRRIDETRWYSNFGPLSREFERKLATHFGVELEHVAVFGNGTLALIHALQAMQVAAGSLCVMPSWTFVATPAAACAAGLTPYFADVSAESWAIEPQTLRQRADLAKFGAVVAVAPFGAPLDHQAWDDFTAQTGLPVLIDGAAAFDAVATQPRARIGRTPVMISLHATKAFGVGEGGVLLSRDADLIARARQWGNFGFIGGEPIAHLAGSNSKVSEYGAAVGLAALGHWPQRRARIARLTEDYARTLVAIGGVGLAPGFLGGQVSNSCNIVTSLPAWDLAARLTRAGVMTRRWWGNGCHAHPAYVACPRDPLPVTERLAWHALGLPFYHDLDKAALKTVCEAVTAALA